LPFGSTGAAKELVVCAYLLEQGFEVFRSVSPSATCDLIAMLRGSTELIRIEVKTAYTRKNGGVVFQAPKEKRHFYDTVAAVLPDWSIEFIPPLSNFVDQYFLVNQYAHANGNQAGP
jgi:Holliday junction resolvase-like predicted endonuclease